DARMGGNIDYPALPLQPRWEKDTRPGMNDTRKPRAVSGEIVTDDASSPASEKSRARRPGPDIIDAEYETIDGRGPAAGGIRTESTVPPSPAAGGLDMLRPGAGQTKRR